MGELPDGPPGISARGPAVVGDDGSEPATVLVVDDDALNRRLLGAGVRSEGHRTLEAASGEAALEVLASSPVDVVLLDILMPGLDGFGVLERMKADAALSGIPVVVVSSIEGTSDIARCIELGAEDFLPKPADRLILSARLTAALRKVQIAQMEQGRVRDVFSRFLPEAVVDQLLAEHEDDLRIGARELTCTVMFNDLRGFTTFAESRSAEEVIEVLNEYLTVMSDAVLGHGGTLVSFLGDGMMSVFGAPVESPDHADRAVAAAREMCGPRLHDLNLRLRQRGVHQGFRLGVGMASGPVMSGNVGSPRRMEYAAVGDTTNTAARVESMTKEVGLAVLMTEETVSLLARERARVTFVDERTVRGRETPVRLWTLSDPERPGGAGGDERTPTSAPR